LDSLPVRAKIYIGAVFAAAASLLGYLAATRPTGSGRPAVDFSLAITFGFFIFISDQFPIKLPLGDGAQSVSFVVILAAIILGGPVEAAIAASFGAVTVRGARDVPFARHLFNASQLALMTTLAGLAFQAVSPHPFREASQMFPDVFLPALAATAVQYLANTSLVAGVVSLVRGLPLGSVWRSLFGKLGGGSFAFGVLGVVLAALHLQMGNASAVFLLVPLLVARSAFQAAIEMETAYEATVRSLIKAIEAKDEYTRGHAERVAKLSQMTARAYGLSAEECRVILYIALMHDVGKLGVSTKILAKPGKLTDEEYEHMKQHPLRGYEIVSEIEFLKAAAETAVRHHHERMDGRGYPDGLVGEQIPVIARIVMVCDAFDSMTSTRVYRKAKSIEDALVELHRCEGTQFDPVSLAALEKALATYGWEAEPEPREEEEVQPGAAVAL
jgi:hypothetical protein